MPTVSACARASQPALIGSYSSGNRPGGLLESLLNFKQLRVMSFPACAADQQFCQAWSQV